MKVTKPALIVYNYRIPLAGKRWYWSLFTNFLDVTMVNAWILAKKANKNKMDLLEFKRYVGTSYLKQNGVLKKDQLPLFCAPLVEKSRFSTILGTMVWAICCAREVPKIVVRLQDVRDDHSHTVRNVKSRYALTISYLSIQSDFS